MSEKIKVDPKNMDLAEKVLTAVGDFIVKEASKFIRSIFTCEDEKPKEEVPVDEEIKKESKDNV